MKVAVLCTLLAVICLTSAQDGVPDGFCNAAEKIIEDCKGNPKALVKDPMASVLLARSRRTTDNKALINCCRSELETVEGGKYKSVSEGCGGGDDKKYAMCLLGKFKKNCKN